MVSRRQFLSGSGAALLGAAMVSKAGAASLPESAHDGESSYATAARAAERPPVHARRDAERLDAAVADEERLGRNST